MSPETWQTVTDGMAQVTLTGNAATAHLEGIDFAGKTGTAQVIGHDALARTNKGHNTLPNAWFVGMAPRRNPDIVVAVLWEHGNWGVNSARLAAQVVDAFVEKQRRASKNLRADAPEACSASSRKSSMLSPHESESAGRGFSRPIESKRQGPELELDAKALSHSSCCPRKAN